MRPARPTAHCRFARTIALTPIAPFLPTAEAELHARLVRRVRPLAARIAARHRGRRLALAAAALAVPAMAAPGGWDMLTTWRDGGGAPRAMPFETAGQSFPGSALYYLEDPAPQPGLAGELMPFVRPAGAEEAPQLAAIVDAGPAARAFSQAGTGIDKARALQCLSMAVYYEAASESEEGQKAVAQVVLNRVAHPAWPNSVCGVVFQGSERQTGCQFTFTCDGSLLRRPSVAGMARARRIAARALAGDVYAPIGLATHYHTVWINPYWAGTLDTVGRIGAHVFYRWRGGAGTRSAFTVAYRGGEPIAAPHPRAALPAAGDPMAGDPAALARALEEQYQTARVAAEQQAQAASPAPVTAQPVPTYNAAVQARGGDAQFVGENLPSGGTVKPEYANSGRWIAQPR